MKSKCVTVLPKLLVQKISDLNLSKANHNNAIRIVMIILRKQQMNQVTHSDFVRLSSKYWKKVIGTRYDLALGDLIKGEIIHIIEHSWFGGICRSFRINPLLISESVAKAEYESEKPKSDPSPECRHTVRFLRELHLDVKEAKRLTEEYIRTGDFRKRIVVDPQFSSGIVIKMQPVNSGYDEAKYYTIDVWRDIAAKQGLVIIQDDEKFYIDDPARYFSKKAQAIRISYYTMILKFKNREYYARINSTNGRLDSNLTSFPSRLLGCFSYRGESLVSIDLKNSQFLMLSKMLNEGIIQYLLNMRLETTTNISPDSPPADTMNHLVPYSSTKIRRTKGFETNLNVMLSATYKDFHEAAKNGKVYELIQEKLNLPEGDAGRQEAKNLMFRIAFAGLKDRSKYKTILKEQFPVVVEAGDAIKKLYKSNAFALCLQMMESRIFITVLKSRLDERGLPAITKHDSVLCPESYSKQVQDVIREVFDREFGVSGYQLKVEALV